MLQCKRYCSVQKSSASSVTDDIFMMYIGLYRNRTACSIWYLPSYSCEVYTGFSFVLAILLLKLYDACISYSSSCFIKLVDIEQRAFSTTYI
jgi:hypothetical protein